MWYYWASDFLTLIKVISRFHAYVLPGFILVAVGRLWDESQASSLFLSFSSSNIMNIMDKNLRNAFERLEFVFF